MQPLLEFCFRISVDVTAGIQEVGTTAKGIRKIVPITGGSFEGPNIKGKVVAGGYDWQLLRSDEVVEIEARYMLQTDDGDLITITNAGLRHGPREVMQRLAKGEEVDVSEYYFRSIPVFETGNPEYAWLTRSVFIATGTRKPKQVLIDVWRIV
ncbi:DUF3237 domain-containing protein [Mucilaginibacter calamicampi]|uniref:UPF0311 protein ACFQZS_16940 n=1 Tax=Mucilaginibacter calamicampi TaxID=1302352 RepID=A0ABW2Z2A4_9SPHI